MSDDQIPFNRPYMQGSELDYITRAMEHGHISGDGLYTRKCQSLLQELLGTPKALLTTSCTDALEMAALLLDIRDGDEVIVPSYTFVSTPNAFVLRGAKPVFVDVRPDTLNLDEALLENAITSKTKAIIPVHYAGVACEMDTILGIAEQHGIAVVEDNAHGLLGKYKGRYLGTFGSLATQSFHETKNVTCGEGGALLINDPALVERAEIVREKGTNRSSFFRGQVDKYTWVDVGSSFLPSDVLAAFLFAQLEDIKHIQSLRERIWKYYFEKLQNWSASTGATLPTIPEHCDQSYHMFYILMPTSQERDALIEKLKRDQIMSVFHYLPLHLSEMGKRFGGRNSDCPVSEDVSGRIIRLPFYNQLSTGEQDRVISAIHKL